MSPATSSAWTDLGRGVRVRQSRAFAMNSGLLLDPEHTLLVDPGVLASELDELASAVAEVRPARLSLLLTHAHWDHVLGRMWWPEAEVIAHDRFASEVQAAAAEILAEATRLAESHGEAWARGFRAFRPQHAVSGLHYARRGPWHLVLRDALGHSDSQLTLHVPERRLLFAADMLSDIEIPLLNQPPDLYRRTLEPLLPLAEHAAIETLVPGHGSIARGRDAVLERLQRDLAYLTDLERSVATAAARGLTWEQARGELEARDLCGWGPPAQNAQHHRENVALAWQAGPKPSGHPGPGGS